MKCLGKEFRFVFRILLVGYCVYKRCEQKKKLDEVLGRLDELDRKTKYLNK